MGVLGGAASWLCWGRCSWGACGRCGGHGGAAAGSRGCGESRRGYLGRGEPQWEPRELSSPGKATFEMGSQPRIPHLAAVKRGSGVLGDSSTSLSRRRTSL